MDGFGIVDSNSFFDITFAMLLTRLTSLAVQWTVLGTMLVKLYPWLPCERRLHRA
jgi:hypothetical protein